MRKIYFLIIIALVSMPLAGQNLVANGDLEQWDDDTHPTGWTKLENIEKEASIVHSGTYSAKHTGGTKDFGQYIDVSPGVTYTISLWYYSIYADGTDCRIWSYWKDGDGASLDDNAAELRGPNDEYLPGAGEWKQYTTTVTAPALAAQFYLEVRTYSGSVTYWDDFSVSASDGTPPVWTEGYPVINNIRDIGGDLRVSMNEPGTVYYVILADGSETPTNAEVKAGIDFGSTVVIKSGNFEVTVADTEVMELLDGADPETSYDIYVVAEDESENLQSEAYRFDVTTGVATGINSKLDSQLKIYPVPADTELIIENIRSLNFIEVLDITGSRVYERVISGEENHRINVSLLPKGIYFLRLSDGTTQTTRKFIKR